jgi:hypothetical protein
VTWTGSDPDEWCVAHDATGDADGSGAAHLILRSTSEQSTFGWYRSSGGCTFADGDTMLMKFRIKYDDHFAYSEDHKIVNLRDSSFRAMLHSRNASTAAADCRLNDHNTLGLCTNDDGDRLECTTDADCTAAGAQYWCLPPNISAQTDGAFSFNKDIATPCAGPAGEAGASFRTLPLDSWLWVQVEATSNSG